MFETRLVVLHSVQDFTSCLCVLPTLLNHFPEQEWKTLQMVWRGNKASNIVTEKKKIQTLRTLGGKKWDSISAEVTLWSVCLAFFVFSRFQEVIWGKRLKACLCLKHKISGSYVQPFTLTWNSPSETNSTWIIKSSSIKKKPQKTPQTDPNKNISYLLLNKVGLKAPKWIKSLQESDRIKSMSQGAGRKQGQLTVCHGATDLKGLHGSSF